jgi:hypothetical protein
VSRTLLGLRTLQLELLLLLLGRVRARGLL